MLGRRVEEFSATELPDDEKPPLLRAYLKKWKWEVGAFFGGVGPDAPEEELRRIAPDHPVFRIELEGAAGAGGAQGEEEDHAAADGHDPHLAADDRQGELLLGLGREGFEVDVAELALGGAGAGALGEEGDEERQDPVEVVEVFGRPCGR